jgi:hypothetical protein
MRKTLALSLLTLKIVEGVHLMGNLTDSDFFQKFFEVH